MSHGNLIPPRRPMGEFNGCAGIALSVLTGLAIIACAVVAVLLWKVAR